MSTPLAPGRATIAEIVADVAGHDARLTGPELGRIVDRVAARPELWRPLVRPHAPERWWVRLHWTASVEVWLLGWEHGHATELHDHGGSSGAFSVTDGTLTELHGNVEGWHGGRARTWAPGRTVSFGPAYVHDLHHPDAGAAVSLHAYSPPLRAMTFYRSERGRLVPDRTEWTAGPEPRSEVEDHHRPLGYPTEVALVVPDGGELRTEGAA